MEKAVVVLIFKEGLLRAKLPVAMSAIVLASVVVNVEAEKEAEKVSHAVKEFHYQSKGCEYLTLPTLITTNQSSLFFFVMLGSGKRSCNPDGVGVKYGNAVICSTIKDETACEYQNCAWHGRNKCCPVEEEDFEDSQDFDLDASPDYEDELDYDYDYDEEDEE